MKRRSYILLVLAIVVLSAVLFMKRAPHVTETSYALPDWKLPVDTSRVVRIGIHRGSASMMIDRKHGSWKYKLGGLSGVDSTMVTRLLEGIADFRLLGLVSSNPRKQDVFDVGETGTAVVVATDDGKELSLVVGKMSSLPSRSYIRPAASDMVFLASGLTPDVVNDESIGGIRQAVFKLDSTQVLSFSIATQQSSLTVHRQGKTWVTGQNPIPHELIAPMLTSLQEIQGEEVNRDIISKNEKPVLSLDIQEQKRVQYDFYSLPPGDDGYGLKASSAGQLYRVKNQTTLPFMQLISFMQSLQPIASNTEVEPVVKPIPSQPKVKDSPEPANSSPPVVQRPKHVASSSREAALPKNTAVSRPPTAQTSQAQRAVPKKTTETTAASSSPEEEELTVHKVKPGETLESIAQTYNITREQLKQWNLLTADIVQAGTELYVFVKR